MACGAPWERMDAAFEPCPEQEKARALATDGFLLLTPEDWTRTNPEYLAGVVRDGLRGITFQPQPGGSNER